MLTVENVSYAIGDRQILNSVSFSLMPGNKVILVGENGAGKSTLLKIIVGEISADEGSINRPSSIGYVPQIITDELSVIEGISVLDFMLEGKGLNNLSIKMREISELMNSGVLGEELDSLVNEYFFVQDDFSSRGGYEAESEINVILNGVGLHVSIDSEVRKLSGGEKTRLAFARSIFTDCDLLILDEPTNHIDRQHYHWLGTYLKQTTKAVLVVSHHGDFINPFSQKIIEIEKLTGRMREYQGTYEAYLEQSVINEKTIMRQLDWFDKEISRIETSARRLQYGGPNQAKAAQNAFKRADRLKAERDNIAMNILAKEKQLRFKLPLTNVSGQIVAKVEKMSKKFLARVIFEEISFEITRGQRIVVVGDNGSGKTTLLRIIIGLLVCDSGSVDLGYNVNLGYYAQEHENLDLDSTVISELQKVSSVAVGTLRNILARFLFFQDKVFQDVKTLSLGEKSRLSLCKLMLGNNNFLVLDEPTNYLDKESRNSVAEAIQDYEGTIIFVSHDKDFISLVKPDKMLTMPQGLMVDFEDNLLN